MSEVDNICQTSSNSTTYRSGKRTEFSKGAQLNRLSTFRPKATMHSIRDALPSSNSSRNCHSSPSLDQMSKEMSSSLGVVSTVRQETQLSKQFSNAFLELDQLNREMQSLFFSCKEQIRQNTRQPQKEFKKAVSQPNYQDRNSVFFKLVEGICFRQSQDALEQLRDNIVAQVLGLETPDITTVKEAENSQQQDNEHNSSGSLSQRTILTTSSLEYGESEMVSLLDLLRYVTGQQLKEPSATYASTLRKLKHSKSAHRVLQAVSELSGLPWICINMKYEYHRLTLNQGAVTLVYSHTTSQFLLVQGRESTEPESQQIYDLYQLSSQEHLQTLTAEAMRRTYSQLYAFFPKLYYLQNIGSKLLSIRVNSQIQLVVQAYSLDKRDSQPHRILIFKKLPDGGYDFVDGEFARHQPLSLHVELQSPGEYIIYTSQSVPQRATIFYNKEIEFRVVKRSEEFEYSLLSSLDLPHNTTPAANLTVSGKELVSKDRQHQPIVVGYYRIEMLKIGLILEKYINNTGRPSLFILTHSQPDDKSLMFGSMLCTSSVKSGKRNEKEVVVSREKSLLKIFQISKIPAYLSAPKVQIQVMGLATQTITTRYWDHL